jgi:hypothetical protein
METTQATKDLITLFNAYTASKAGGRLREADAYGKRIMDILEMLNRDNKKVGA